MSRIAELELLEADARYYRERIALMKAKQYGRGLGSSARLQELERELERAEQRLRHARQEHVAPPDQITDPVRHGSRGPLFD